MLHLLIEQATVLRNTATYDAFEDGTPTYTEAAVDWAGVGITTGVCRVLSPKTVLLKQPEGAIANQYVTRAKLLTTADCPAKSDDHISVLNTNGVTTRWRVDGHSTVSNSINVHHIQLNVTQVENI